MKYVDIFECDEPLVCGVCPFSIVREKLNYAKTESEFRTSCSKLSTDILPGDMGSDGRLKNCPIKPLPMPRSCNYYNFEGYQNGYDKGWNDCLEHLTN